MASCSVRIRHIFVSSDIRGFLQFNIDIRFGYSRLGRGGGGVEHCFYVWQHELISKWIIEEYAVKWFSVYPSFCTNGGGNTVHDDDISCVNIKNHIYM